MSPGMPGLDHVFAALSDPTRRAAMGGAARDLVERRYDVEKIWDRLLVELRNSQLIEPAPSA